jgi:hypothetical protein
MAPLTADPLARVGVAATTEEAEEARHVRGRRGGQAGRRRRRGGGPLGARAVAVFIRLGSRRGAAVGGRSGSLDGLRDRRGRRRAKGRRVSLGERLEAATISTWVRIDQAFEDSSLLLGFSQLAIERGESLEGDLLPNRAPRIPHHQAQLALGEADEPELDRQRGRVVVAEGGRDAAIGKGLKGAPGFVEVAFRRELSGVREGDEELRVGGRGRGFERQLLVGHRRLLGVDGRIRDALPGCVVSVGEA